MVSNSQVNKDNLYSEAEAKICSIEGKVVSSNVDIVAV